ncbi:MAG: glycoside hydrolase family 2 TIM barrel-domain containing protein [Phycisphaerales bacterium]|jgi:hypothetical protein|nr:glycoside hydrolase family 2 TIM barrel-domain containing protein [Phycisphaerales bacterium]
MPFPSGSVLSIACLALSLAPCHAGEVEVRATPAGYRVFVDGSEYTIRGAGGTDHLEELVSCGGNTIRTWGQDQLDSRTWPDGTTESVLDRAERLGLKVVVGYWLEHPAHGFNYADEAAVQAQLDDVRSFIESHKDHPAVLMWCIGNEVAGGDTPARPFIEIERAARVAKEADPNHPVMTALAGVWGGQVAMFNQHCKHVDVLGVNIYGAAPAISQEILRQGYTGPYAITEFGPIGHWESGVTAWGAEIEQPTSAKAAMYRIAYELAVDAQRDRCLGAFAFLWGNKQERTWSWYSMFLPSGEKTEAVDEISHLWTGHWPKNRAPSVGWLKTDAPTHGAKGGSTMRVSVPVSDPENDPLATEWFFTRESTDKQHGGAPEAAPSRLEAEIVDSTDHAATLRIPKEPGPYRLFVVVRDGKGGAGTANLPFLVVGADAN